MGPLEKREIRNRLKVLLTHLLKWKFQPGRRGDSWMETMFEQRENITDILESSQSLRPYFQHAMRAGYRGAKVGPQNRPE